MSSKYVSVNRKKNNSTPKYKQALEDAKKLRGRGGVFAYDRASLLCDVYNDPEIRDDIALADDRKLLAVLDDLVQDLCLNFLSLRSMLEHYPKREQWASGRLNSMYKEMQEKFSAPVKAPSRTRRAATIAEVDHLKSEVKRRDIQIRQLRQTAPVQIKRYEQATVEVQSELEKKDEEIAKLKKELKEARLRIKELEVENKRLKGRCKVAA